MRKIAMLGALAGISAGSFASAAPLSDLPNKIGTGRRNYATQMRGVPANINRHTGQPHEHKREMARRVRQLAAQEAGQ